MKKTLLILAAGMGSRYGGLKQLDNFGPNSQTIIDYSIYDAIKAGFDKVVFVIRRDFSDNFIKIFDEKLNDKIEVKYVFQDIKNVPNEDLIHENRVKPWGTGHAILCAKDAIDESFAIINADDFYGRDAFFKLSEFLENSNDEEEYSMIGYNLGKTLSEFGTVSRGVCEVDSFDNLVKIIERTKVKKNENGDIYHEDLEKNERVDLHKNSTVSMNCFAVKKNFFEFLENDFKEFFNENYNELKSEFYFPFVISDALKNNKIKVKVIKNDSSWFGVTYPQDKIEVTKNINNLIDDDFYPKNLWEK